MKDLSFYIDKANKLIKKFAPRFDYLKIYLTPSVSTEVEVLNGKVENVSFSETSYLTAVGSKDGKTATVSGNYVKDEDVEGLINYLTNLLKVVEKDPYFVLPDKSDIGKANAELDIFDGSVFSLTPEHYVKEARLLEDMALKKDGRVKSAGAFSESFYGITVFANSYGFVDGFEKTYFAKGVMLTVDDTAKNSRNIGRKQKSGWWSVGVKRELLKSDEEIANTAIKRVVSKIGTVKPKTGVFPVVFENIAARSFFSSVASALTGSNLYRKESFLLDKLGDNIASEKLTVLEQPLLKNGLGSRLFDSDGVKAKNFPVIEKGILKNYLLGVYSANRLGLKTTGSAGGYSNFTVLPGEKRFEEIISNIKYGILVSSLKGQGANIKTGDYSRGAEGFLIENGEITKPVSEFTVSSSFQEMLVNIKEIASDSYSESSIITPSVLFDKITVSGK